MAITKMILDRQAAAQNFTFGDELAGKEAHVTLAGGGNNSALLDVKGVIKANELQVTNLTTISGNEVQLGDNIITLNADFTGDPVEDAGIEINRGNEDTVFVKYDEAKDYWVLTNNGSDVYKIITELELNNAVTTINNDLSAHAADTHTHGVVGDIVGTQNTQTLTNKTIDGHNNTLNVLESQIEDGDILARLAEDETITGKWLFDGGIVIQRGLDANKPSEATEGQLFWATDTDLMYVFTGSSWVVVSKLSNTAAKSVGTTNSVGTSTECARADHVHQGIHSIKVGVGGTLRFGDITLVAGANTTITDNGNGQITISASVPYTIVTREQPSGDIDGINKTFTLSHTPIAGSEEVFFNGLCLDSGTNNDYVLSGNTITFTTDFPAPLPGDKIRVSYRY